MKDVISREADRQHTRTMAKRAWGKISRVAWVGEAGSDNRPLYGGGKGPVGGLSRGLWE